MEQYANNAVSTTTGSINNTSDPVTFTLTSAASFPSTGNFSGIINNEILEVVSVSGNVLIANRAQEGTTIASHASGATFTAVLTKASLLRLVADSFTYGSAYASIPAAGRQGRLYVPGDGTVWSDTGSAWTLYIDNIGPFTPPSGFSTQLNYAARGAQDTTHGFTKLSDNAPSGSGNYLICNVKTPPSPPWTLTVVMAENEVAISSSGGFVSTSGAMIRDSSTGYVKGFCRSFDRSQYEIDKFTSFTAFSASDLLVNAETVGSKMAMFRITNDGTHLKYYLSRNFVDWIEVYTELVAGNHVATIDQVGFYINFANSPLSNAQTGSVNFYHAVCA